MSKPNLNPEQSKIVKYISGAVLVLAPVGTGKTRVLTERVVSAIQNGIPASKILCLTFTNRAAKEMSDRLLQTIPDAYRYINVKTFHSLCASMLRVEARQIGLPADFGVYDDADCIELVKNVFGISKDKEAQQIFFEIANCKIKASDSQLCPNYPVENLFRSLKTYNAKLASLYQAILQERHALDFADLVFYVRAMLHHQPEIRKRWEERFYLIQVDEVQDTHLSEYEIVKTLASRSGNLAMIGDLDQTIYEWRGSEPDQVIAQFKYDFNPTEYSLKLNYRATKTLLNAASAFADSFEHRQTQINPASECESGDLIRVYTAKNEREEGEWIAKQIKNLASERQSFAYNRVAVLTRTQNRISSISSVLEQFGVKSITIEQYQFFMRQEVKDVLAYLRFILNPFDTGSLRRLLLRPSRGMGSATIESVIEEGEACGFRLTDMAFSQTFENGDPFSGLLEAYTFGKIVVFDVETTGFLVNQDEVVEIAAVRLINGKPAGEFHAFIANTVGVGDSEQIHGHSDQFLAIKGRPAKTVFREFFNFASEALLVGHNVGFDIKMVTAHACKVGLVVPQLQWTDTWNLANRFIKADSYSLEALSVQLNLIKPTHKAIDDTRTTVELLKILIPLIEPGAAYRQALVYRYGDVFEGLAEQINNWRNASQELRPAELLNKLLLESGLQAYYQNDEQRLQNMHRLVKIFQEWDNPALHPDTAIRSILDFTALAKNLDQISSDNNQVPIITIHQAKGLEFDTVFIAGVSEGEIPSFFSVRDEKLEEEKRLFYVAMTRAKKRLFISAYLKNSWNKCTKPSNFINFIPKEFIEFELENHLSLV